MDLAVYAHPDGRSSHNAAVLAFVREFYDEQKRQLDVINLYNDAFSPLYTQQEYAGEKNTDRLVAAYQEKISGAGRLVFIHPVWWYGPPAILKGFFDRVFTPGFAYNFKKPPSIPAPAQRVLEALCGQGICYPLFLGSLPVEKKLAGKKAVVINTYGGNKMGFNLFGRAPELSIDKAVLNFCGIEPVVRINWFEARGPPVVPQDVKEQIRRALQ